MIRARPDQQEASLGLSLENVRVSYDTKRARIDALGPLDLKCRDGEFVAIIGPSGCGKSTLLKLVAGLLGPTEGTITLAGRQVRGPRSDVGIVFQQPTLLPWKTVRDNVLMPLKVLGTYQKSDGEVADRLLASMGLDGFTRNYPFELSGGMQQRVGIARSLIHDPRILLMDEPFAALDALRRETIMVELQSTLERRGKLVLFITHSIPEAVFLADRIVVMSERPGTVIHEEMISMPKPRTIESMGTAEFGAICQRLRQLLIH